MLEKKSKLKETETATESPIKVDLSPSELQALNELSSDSSFRSRSPLNKQRHNPALSDPNNWRFIATNSVLLTSGLIGLLVNTLLANAEFGDLRCLLASLIVLPYSWFTFEWQRLNGITLSRKLRPIVNVASVLATYKQYDPLYHNLYADMKDRIFSCCDEPQINPDLVRTAEETSDQARSPPKATNSSDLRK